MRDLKTVSKSGLSASYNYNADGFRVSKTVNGVTTQFVLDDSGNILKQTSGSNTLLFLYDDNGGRVGLQYNGANYLYVYNAQGDVTAIVDSNHNVVVSYTYDEWGNKVSVTGSMSATLGVQNPFRYRGYCYDEETGWYYLQTRYYDPVTGRFLNADSQINSTILGANLFAYCENNPVNMVDYNGRSWEDVKNWFSNAWDATKEWVENAADAFSKSISGSIGGGFGIGAECQIGPSKGALGANIGGEYSWSYQKGFEDMMKMGGSAELNIIKNYGLGLEGYLTAPKSSVDEYGLLYAPDRQWKGRAGIFAGGTTLGVSTKGYNADFVLSFGAGLYCIIGMEFEASFNLSTFWEELNN